MVCISPSAKMWFIKNVFNFSLFWLSITALMVFTQTGFCWRPSGKSGSFWFCRCAAALSKLLTPRHWWLYWNFRQVIIHHSSRHCLWFWIYSVKRTWINVIIYSCSMHKLVDHVQKWKENISVASLHFDSDWSPHNDQSSLWPTHGKKFPHVTYFPVSIENYFLC